MESTAQEDKKIEETEIIDTEDNDEVEEVKDKVKDKDDIKGDDIKDKVEDNVTETKFTTVETKKTEVTVEKKPVTSIIIGMFETCNVNGITGWVADRSNFNAKLEVEINIDDIMFYKVKANLFMDALAKARIGDGKFAFHVPLPNSMFDGLEHTISVKELSTSTVLRGSPKKFTAQIFEHPSIKDGAIIDKLKSFDLTATKPVTVPYYTDFLMPTSLKFGYTKQELPSGEYGALRKLGYSMFGSIIAPFVVDVSKILLNHVDKPVLFLMREGYHLYDLFDRHYVRTGHVNQRHLLKKLVVSRSFLFKLLLDDKNSLHLALTHPFNGTFLSLLTHRFALTPADIAKINSEFFNLRINCPNDKDLLIDLIYNTCLPIFEEIAKKRYWYRNYVLETIDNQRDVVCIDLGFSGTIQRILTTLFDIKTHGYYLILSNWSDYPKLENCEAEGFWGETKRGNADPLVDYSLIIEGMLTAPHGQLMDVSQHHGKIEFMYGIETMAQKKFHYTYPLIHGIDDYVEIMYNNNLSKRDVESVINFRQNYWLHLCSDQSSEMVLLKQLVEVDDHISGLGIINPFSVLGGLKL